MLDTNQEKRRRGEDKRLGDRSHVRDYKFYRSYGTVSLEIWERDLRLLEEQLGEVRRQVGR